MAKQKGLRNTKYSFNHMLVVALAFAVIGGAVSWAAFAAPANKGGGKPSSGSSSLKLVMVTDNNNDGLPNFNDTITFSVQSTQTTLPTVDVHCFQNGTLVYSATAGFFDGYLWPGSRMMQLASPSWTSGAADCTAYLNLTQNKGGKISALTTLDFHVNP